MEDLQHFGGLESLPWEVLATISLDPRKTDDLFVRYSGAFVEICARWLSSGKDLVAKIAAFGRILPFAPHLAEHVERFFTLYLKDDFPNIPQDDIREFLLSLFRLSSLQEQSYAPYIRPRRLESFLHHPDMVIRYLSVRVLCQYLNAADAATEDVITEHVGQEAVEGNWEGLSIDYRFLSLWEEKRYSDMAAKLQNASPVSIPATHLENLSPLSVNVHGELLPRLGGPPPSNTPSDLISTQTTVSNLQEIARSLLSPEPLLLTGLPGSCKTGIIRHFARQLSKLDSMITLHLNEQSDAKLLIGMYTTGKKPGTFAWRNGLLSTAVREGRWIFIEDLDKAPNDVISTLLPLIERGELLIPSRGETIKAARGFKLIATMRSTLNPKGEELIPRQNMLGIRFWRHVSVQMPPLEEFAEIVSAKYPTLDAHVPAILRVYSRLLVLFSEPQFASDNGTSLRALTPRDLLKWCDRISGLLEQSNSFTSERLDEMFMDSMDIFAGSLSSEQNQLRVMACVAEELHIDPQRRDHLLLSREVKFDTSTRSTASGTLQIGRARLPRQKIQRKTVSGKPFSTNDYTLRLLEKIAVAVDRQEPLLLVSETGAGKTTSIQYLAEQTGHKLVVFNLSQQSSADDLLGGYRPVNLRNLVIPMKDEFYDLFDMSFSRKKNQRFIEMLGKRVTKGEWKRVCMLWKEALKMVNKSRAPHESRTSSEDPEDGQPKKKRKVDSLPLNFPKARWDKFATDLNNLEAQLANGSEAFAFSFVEGNIVKAVRNGDWILLDEINLASSDTLQAIVDLLSGGPDGTPSILLTETGNAERVVSHPNFRIFAAMNPATDVAKKNLPEGIRSRFTEIYVESPDSDEKSLRNIVERYLCGQRNDPAIIKLAADVTELFQAIQRLSKQNMLVDGADQKPHFSLRTLTRTLVYARDMAPFSSLRRALYEGFQMSFLTSLNQTSEDLVAGLLQQHLFSKPSQMKTELAKPFKRPDDGKAYVQEERFWLRQGPEPIEDQPQYIITPFIRRNLNNLIRATSSGLPVLLQGPTSAGKTSMIEYLAKRSGNKFVRINNHEHTDLQEYLGTYVSGPDGKLQFQEGILVRALREGHWIVLDELNLAPSDVLESINRLLDDNRELMIPETQTVVTPHEDFHLFATQNPAGLYAGRKHLSRAFRNRFLELHFDDVPVDELAEILQKRTQIPESWCKRIVGVYQELSSLRQENRLFEQKSFATLRDLFRWALRKADTVQDLANNGYMLLAERVRKEEERHAVKEIIERLMSKGGPRVQIDVDALFSEERSAEIKLYKEKGGSSGVVWTRAMRRLYVLVAHALRNNEPVLLVGETGTGKTSCCQMLADAFGKQLNIVNAHQNTEAGDLIGAQRPVRNRASIEDFLRQQLLDAFALLDLELPSPDPGLAGLLELYDGLGERTNSIPFALREEIRMNRTKAAALFEWQDGSLVTAMKTGSFFLLDEISLADDSVLERLNSVLEPSRTLLLAEKGPLDSFVVASEGYEFVATMNPGGDFGKKELSQALRNRFTEIWVPALSNDEDVIQIVRSKLKPEYAQYAGSIVSFSQWFNDKYNASAASSISIRDTLAWIAFINKCQHSDPVFAVVHGAAMVFIDTLGANPAALLAISPESIDDERNACLHHLSKLLGTDTSPYYWAPIDVAVLDTTLEIGSFSIPRFAQAVTDPSFSLEAPTTRANAMRVVRALQLSKPILLEGNPGVGKTTLVTALARACGKPLTRLNLSEQTDITDLFGVDCPVEEGQAGTFAWRDAPFLRALKSGGWVLLDEANLANQTILEGINSIIDHRGEIYISELDQTFLRHPDFRLFAAQNPHNQGSGRKGLPASFINRFTVVYADVFRPDDLSLICKQVFPQADRAEVTKLINFVGELDRQVVTRRAFGMQGSPWEFNLRDTLRWLQLLTSREGLLPAGNARDFLDTIFVQRFRTQADRDRVLQLFANSMHETSDRKTLYHNLVPEMLQIGLGGLQRNPLLAKDCSSLRLSASHLGIMESLMISVQLNWPVILVGPASSGKTSFLNQLASFAGADLVTFAMNADVDANDFVGSFEQLDRSRDINRFLRSLREFVRQRLIRGCPPTVQSAYLELFEALRQPRMTIGPHLESLVNVIVEHDHSSQITEFAYEHARLIEAPGSLDGARFQWVDGLLVQALEQGKWLVLDNANLCNGATIDRLNGLLEPNGCLVINEHPTADGEARIVSPHPNFRIFMTMDAKFGELSRAMRNRAVELCLIPEEGNAVKNAQVHLPTYPLDSRMYRFRHLMNFNEVDGNGTVGSLDQLSIACDHLSGKDSDLLESFQREISKGLYFDSRPVQPLVYGNGNGVVNGINGVNGNITARRSAQLEGLACMSSFLGSWHPKAAAFQDRLGQLTGFPGTPETQPYHPLNDETLVHYNAETFQISLFAASLYDVMFNVSAMSKALDTMPSLRLERRAEKNKIPKFLRALCHAMASWIDDACRNDETAVASTFATMERLRVLFYALLELAKSAGFDKATFYTYLAMLNGAGSSLHGGSHSNLGKALTREIAHFGSGIQLKSGLRMEEVWRRFKPMTARSSEELEMMLKLGSLADRFDDTIWKSSVGLDDLCHIRESLSNALSLVGSQEVQAEELVKGLENGINQLEQNISEDNQAMTPFFEEEFEGICQFLDVVDNDNTRSDIALLRAKSSLLARRPTKVVMVGSGSAASQAFTHLYNHLGTGRKVAREVALGNRFHTSLLKKMNEVDEITLMQLDRFEAELQNLGQHISLETARLAGSPYQMFQTLWTPFRTLMGELLSTQDVNVTSWAPLDFQAEDNSLHGTVRKSIDSCIQVSRTLSSSGHSNPQTISEAWITLALAGISLYVPDRPFDPALRPMIERQFFKEKRAELTGKLDALREFQHRFTGQNTSLRIRFAQQEIEEMGEELAVPAVARPAVSELEDLQGEFSNLLSVLQPLLDGNIAVTDLAADQTFRQNLDRIIERLHERYRFYDDITSTAVGFLVCLNVGLHIAGIPSQWRDTWKSIGDIATYTPFVGFHGALHDFPALSLMPCCKRQANASIDLRWHGLHALRIAAAMDKDQAFDLEGRQLAHDILSSFYGEWKEKLLQDQQKEAAKSSLYTYHGAQDEQEMEEEDRTLFPDFDQEEGDGERTPASNATSQDLAVRLAGMHHDMFLGGVQPVGAIKRLLGWCSTEIGNAWQGEYGSTELENTLPAILLSIQQKSDSLSSEAASDNYNFYFDANIHEAKRLIDLVHRIQQRYRAIQRVWPEHATLGDVLRTCDEALAFRHVDPVAKFLTKAEKLHGYVHEWQRVASREYSTAALYDKLTELLVSWRRLELTTWARLFDIEAEKFRDAAKGWFFIAYENIIAAPESLLSDPRAMKTHAKELLKTLEGFFTSTSMGQYEQRTKLLQQISAHLAMRARDEASLEPIHLALDNFIAYFARLERPIQDILAKGRQALEKEVKDVIQLASWKDTNIEALKQSAKTSHRKLSKIVRKFRNLLNQPVSGIVKAGFPEEHFTSDRDATMPKVSINVDDAALHLCNVQVPDWNDRPTRFRNLLATTKIMRSKSLHDAESLDGAKYIESFITDLDTSIIQLQKANPATLTEENKELVKHLKTRKRKVYAETMKALKEMGFTANPSADLLAKQDELSTVLANLPPLQGDAIANRPSTYFLHKTLSIMPHVREVSKEHSGDLTSNDVSRSIGYLESLFHASIRQRNILSQATNNYEKVRHPVARISQLWSPGQWNVIKSSTSSVQQSMSLENCLSWIAVLLNVGADLVEAQAKLGKIDLSMLSNGLREHSKQCDDMSKEMSLPFESLPENVWTTSHAARISQMQEKLRTTEEAVMKWMSEYPLVAWTLKQILPWFKYEYEETLDPDAIEESRRISVKEASQNVLNSLDLILGSMQDIETALEGSPLSTEDPTWLIKEQQALSAALTAFHAPQIGKSFKNIVDSMQYLQDSTHTHGGVQVVSALFTSVLPIIQQYQISYQSLLDRLHNLHVATTKLSYRLSKAFIQVGTQGFCTPPEKSTGEQPGKDDKLESGTGLGEGEGAEDISKDIEDDEDLDDLAQQQDQNEREGSIEDEKDAVDMADKDMEGEMGDVEEKGSQDGEGDEGSEDDIEDEVGSVDDLGPAAVDEKMWDEGIDDKDEGKDKEGEADVGTENTAEQAASKERKEEKEKGQGEERENAEEQQSDEEMEGADEDENVGVGETEKIDPFTKEEERLDLPDELNMDGEQDEGQDEDDGLGDLEDEKMEDADAEEGLAEPDAVDTDIGEEDNEENPDDTTGHIGDEEEPKEEEQAQDEGQDDSVVPLPEDQPAAADQSNEHDDNEHKDSNAEAGAGLDAHDDPAQNQDASESAAAQQEGNKGESSEHQQESSAEEGKMGQTAQPDAAGRGQDADESYEAQPFKQIGDALNNWYNQQRQIRDASKKDEKEVQETDREVDMADAEFEHLPDEESRPDAQAIGAASEEQAKALDESMALPTKEDEERIMAIPEDKQELEPERDNEDVDMQDAESAKNPAQTQGDGRPEAFIGEQKPLPQPDQEMEEALPAEDDNLSDTSSITEVENQLQDTHLDLIEPPDNVLPTPETARTLWLHHESSTHPLSQQLTEHLRLILAPTLATKLRGDFRTGKRLNLKRIIPYIASGYKRDKIWLRRSQPSKRNYQILIALDDSKSMAESGASNLALKTLALVARSLAMLEVGEVSVVGFGEDVTVAHEFDKPFTSEAGVEVFSKFGFHSKKTDVRGLILKSLKLFEEARMKGASSQGDIWQLMLILSDGICDNHADIQRLVRQAQEKRVMIVFIVVDATANSAEVAREVVGGRSGEKTSIMDLQSVEFTEEGKMVKWRYMDRFPFRWFLVVRDLRELPSVLSTALRQWFAEVVDSAG